MNKFLKRIRLIKAIGYWRNGFLVGLSLLVFAFPVIVRSAEISRKAEIPLLSVSGQGTGTFDKVLLRLSRDENDTRPLAVSVVEDTPLGAGDMMRASLWMAAVVAALERADSLAGTEITLRVHGNVDGPSAGGMLCLGIMSLLDGRELPNDFVFTGAILPDGSIGMVGGLAAKIEAAAEAKKTRVLIPDFIRCENDPITDRVVDLVDLAERRGLTLLPVRTIDQAYAVIHGLSYAEATHGGAVMLPPTWDQYFVDQCRKRMRSGSLAYFVGVSPQPQAETKTNPAAAKADGRDHASSSDAQGSEQAETMVDLLLKQARDSGKNAQEALAGGNVVYAANEAGSYDMFERGVSRTLIELDKNTKAGKEDPWEPLIKQADYASLHKVDAWPAELAAQKFHPIAAQLCTEDITTTWGCWFAWFNSLIAKTHNELNVAKNANKKADIQRLESFLIDLYHSKCILGKCAHLCEQEYMSDIKQKVSIVPQAGVSLRPNLKCIANLFYAAGRAVNASFEAEYLKPMSERAKMSVADYDLALCIDNINYALYRWTADTVWKQHDLASKGNSEFTDTLDTLKNASLLAQVAGGVKMKYGDLSWGTPELYGNLIRRARQRAQSAINECMAAGIPCVVAVEDFKVAEHEEYSNDTTKEIKDRTSEILTKYWGAFLYAKAMKLMFVADQSVAKNQWEKARDAYTDALTKADVGLLEKRKVEAWGRAKRMAMAGQKCGTDFANGCVAYRQAQANLMAAEKMLESGMVPGGCKIKPGAGLEQYTNSGWAKEVIHTQTGIELVYIPSGTFTMGSPETESGRCANETPHKEVIAQGFYLSRSEVTQGQWKEVMMTSLSDQAKLALYKMDTLPSIEKPNNAMAFVSWDDARLFCCRTGFLLPTESQWEYACRAGSETAAYTGGLTVSAKFDVPELDPLAWYGGNSATDYPYSIQGVSYQFAVRRLER